mgnify:CR=1 FL=1
MSARNGLLALVAALLLSFVVAYVRVESYGV